MCSSDLWATHLVDEAEGADRVLVLDHGRLAEIGTHEELLAQSAARPLVFAISLHTFIMGQPHRLKVLRNIFRRIKAHRDFDRVWLTTPGAIADHCLAMQPGIIPGS